MTIEQDPMLLFDDKPCKSTPSSTSEARKGRTKSIRVLKNETTPWTGVAPEERKRQENIYEVVVACTKNKKGFMDAKEQGYPKSKPSFYRHK